MSNQKKPTFFDAICKEAKDLFGLDLSSLKDKKQRAKLIRGCIPYFIFGYAGDLLGRAYRLSKAKDVAHKLMDTINSLGKPNLVPSFHWKDLLVGIAFGVAIKLVVYFKSKNSKKYRKGKEYGSAEFGGPKDIEPFINRTDPDNNLIFTQTEQMSLEGRMPSPLYNRNKNVLIIGGSGSGKTRFYAKPNLMQLNCSYVFTDPKGKIFIR